MIGLTSHIAQIEMMMLSCLAKDRHTFVSRGQRVIESMIETTTNDDNTKNDGERSRPTSEDVAGDAGRAARKELAEHDNNLLG